MNNTFYIRNRPFCWIFHSSCKLLAFDFANEAMIGGLGSLIAAAIAAVKSKSLMRYEGLRF